MKHNSISVLKEPRFELKQDVSILLTFNLDLDVF